MEAQARINQKIKTVLSLERCWPIFLGLLLWGCHSREGTPIPGTPGELPGVTLLMPDTKALFESPSWSPDGTRLAYSQTEYVLPSPNPFSAEIYVLDLESGHSVPLTDNEDADLDPDWSPDGSRIVFVRMIDMPGWDNYYLMTMASDGSDQQILLHCESECASPKWSPDGKTITFWMGGVWLLQPDGSGLYEIDTESIVLPPCSWYPDSKRIVCGGRDYIVELNLSNNQERVIVSDLPVWWPEPDLSPDGKFILFSADPGPADSFVYDILYIVDANGGNPRRIISANLIGDVFDAVWSPDGMRVVIAFGFHDYGADLYILDLTQLLNNHMLNITAMP